MCLHASTGVQMLGPDVVKGGWGVRRGCSMGLKVSWFQTLKFCLSIGTADLGA
jgi:hypothetical protein